MTSSFEAVGMAIFHSKEGTYKRADLSHLVLISLQWLLYDQNLLKKVSFLLHNSAFKMLSRYFSYLTIKGWLELVLSSCSSSRIQILVGQDASLSPSSPVYLYVQLTFIINQVRFKIVKVANVSFW